MKKKIAIIGAGPGGYTAALHASRMGADVTLVEKDKTGGICLNWGCIPSKVFKNTADILEKVKQAELFGITGVQDPNVDMFQLVSRQEAVISTLAKGIDAQLQKANVSRINGKGTISGQGLLQIEQADGSIVDLAWDKLIIAAGSKPLELPGLSFDGQVILSSNDLLKLKNVPQSMLIVGGGVIGCEFAFILSSFGCQVTVVEALDRLLPLPSIDQEVSKVLARQMKKRGIKYLLNSVVDSVSDTTGKVEVSVCSKKPGDSGVSTDNKTISVEKVAVCVGRQSLASELDLENVQLALDDRGWLTVNEQMQTTHPDVYAIGDILGPSKPMLAHAAVKEAFVAVKNCMEDKVSMDYRFVPSVVFSDPEIGCVGISEQEASDQGMDVETKTVHFRASGKAHAIGEIDGFAKIIAECKSGTIVGVHIIGPHASDILGEAVVLVNKGITVNELADTIHAHPTLAELLMDVAHELEGKG